MGLQAMGPSCQGLLHLSGVRVPGETLNGKLVSQAEKAEGIGSQGTILLPSLYPGELPGLCPSPAWGCWD